MMAKTILVTGSSVGLGRSIVEAALASGMNVIATARSPASLADLASQAPEQTLALKLDVTDRNEIGKVVAQATDRFGRLDILVNNAGFSGIGSIEDFPNPVMESLLATNFLGAVNVSQAVLPIMRAQGYGRILFISSLGARVAVPGGGIYFATKAAISALAQSLALEVAPFGIGVTSIEPGAMRTRFAEADSLQVCPFDAAYDDSVGATVAMMRSPEYMESMRDPDAVARMILQVAALDEPPSRILAGADSFEMGIAAGDALRTSDQRFEALSRSAD